MQSNLQPKKSLGQNFLTNKKIVEDIVVAAELKPDDVVLEVGPGKGVLTEELLKKLSGPKTDFSQENKNLFGQGRVVAVEKDGDLVEFLKGKFKKEIESGKLILIHDDILDMKFEVRNSKSDLRFAEGFGKARTNSNLPAGGQNSNTKQEKENTIYDIKNTTYKIVANLPYYITSHFLRKFLESDNQPSLMVLMIQDEVAKRIVARDGKESILSISVKAYGHPEIVRYVAAGNFFPAPKVDSAVLKISHISKEFFGKRTVLGEGAREINEQDLFALVKAGFSGKRKMLKNNLMHFAQTKSYPQNKGLPFVIGDNLKKCGISEKARAEDLKLEDWIRLYGALR